MNAQSLWDWSRDAGYEGQLHQTYDEAYQPFLSTIYEGQVYIPHPVIAMQPYRAPNQQNEPQIEIADMSSIRMVSNSNSDMVPVQRILASSEINAPESSLMNIGGQFWFCNQCAKVIERRDRALGHEARHAGVNAFQCGGACGLSDCSGQFVSKEQLRSHCNRPKEACDICGLVLLKRNMGRHLREIHQMESRRKSTSK